MYIYILGFNIYIFCGWIKTITLENRYRSIKNDLCDINIIKKTTKKQHYFIDNLNFIV